MTNTLYDDIHEALKIEHQLMHIHKQYYYTYIIMDDMKL